ncbi:SDR family oxidoreductase [Wenzhouxiangella marina]|uniref:Oxidoreductase, short chain dehydrogenase/reductase family protein n=1 Tax=Wenzhouxiangella marina TaxID=1579979 RepID=A0A0K0XVV7_9GAMM|nr:SDR family oxidoreductase [Wenzhouxiangella marina]AKS41757.1 Oxidoreductase, short chain dehydrogenase/reductase family protein [Wenzhouxiangella marina]MBB6086481.1 NADP-dependent 3-hydroxy acid dehydrogenase YdfG [Wenzhouxiangella marina]
MPEQDSRRPSVLITGGGAGLGEAMARRFAAAGYAVMVADLDEDRARGVAESLGASARWFVMDITDESAWTRAIEAVREEFGGLDVLVNNAGVAVGGSLEETSMEDWRWVIEIDLLGVVAGCKAFAPMMREQGRGHIINVASFAGFAAAPGINAYGTAKAGVVALSEMLRAELAPAGVEVSVLCPAFVKTRLTETMRAPDDSYQRRVERWMQNSGVTAEDVAQTVFAAVRRPRFMLLTHGNTRWAWRLKRWFPERYYRMLIKQVKKAERRARRG